MKRRNKSGRIYENYDYWQSYSDLMAGLLLMFILIMSGVLVMEYRHSIKSELEYKEQQRLLDEKNQQINSLLGIKPQIVHELREKLSGYQVDIDANTGDIQFKSDILFDYNQTLLKEQGSTFLSQFMPSYLSILLSDKYVNSIAEIIIEGHTDNIGGYTSNLKLSQDRALCVANFVVGESSKFVSEQYKEQIRKIITVTGKSYTNPIYTDESKTVIDQDKSRRVEIKFRLKDDETIDELQKILKGE